MNLDLGGGLKGIYYNYSKNRLLTSIEAGFEESTLFTMFIRYDESTSIWHHSPLQDGNISGIVWYTNDGIYKEYAYEYDFLKRLKDADYYEDGNDGDYTTHYTYEDHRGNFNTVSRMSPDGMIDNLNYNYYSGTNKIKSISDGSSAPFQKKGYKANTASDFTYDANGAMDFDAGRGVDIEVNHLDLPNQIIVPDSNGLVMYYYSADGVLKRQEEIRDNVVYKVRDYIGSVEYINGAIDQIRHSNGYITLDKGLSEEHLVLSGTETTDQVYESLSTISERLVPDPRNTTYKAEEFIVLTPGFQVDTGAIFLAQIDTFPVLGLDYRYFIKDHLGNVRVIFTDANNDNIPEVMDTKNYYPFGGQWESNTNNDQGKLKHLKLGGERQTSFNLDYDMHAFRDYSPWVGRWNGPEPLAEIFSEWSSYAANGNNPVNNVDPLGLDWYRHDGTGKVHWQEGSDDLDGFKNIGANYILEGTNSYIIHNQNEVVGTIGRGSNNESAILSNRVEEGEDYTISQFITSGNDPVTGYFLEPAGLYGLGTLIPEMNKRIPLGTYNIENYSSTSYPNHYRLYNEDVSKKRKILIHAGNYADQTEGCLLPGSSTSNGNVWRSADKLRELRQYINIRDIKNVKLIINYQIIQDED